MEENNITVDKAVQTIKGAILRAQAQASQSSNAIQLSLYYGIGRYVSINLQQAHWGAKALDSISERLQRELPGLRGFSSGNLKKMRIFYEEWQCLSIGSPLANQLQQLENKIEELGALDGDVVLFILLYTAITVIQMLKSDRIGRKSK